MKIKILFFGINLINFCDLINLNAINIILYNNVGIQY